MTTTAVKKAPAKPTSKVASKVAAEAAKLAAEARRADAQAEQALAEAREAAARAAINELNLHEAEREWKSALAADASNRVYNFVGKVDGNTVGYAQAALSRWHRMYPDEPIEIVFNSPGGGVFEGMALYDYIRHLSREGHHITTVCRGMAASMGGILLQAGDTRVIGAESYVLIHEISTMAAGKVGDLKDEVAFLEKMSDRVIDIFVNRSGGKLTKRKIQAAWKKTDWWLDSTECLELGVVDEIR